MKLTNALIIAITLLIGSCKKDDNTKPTDDSSNLSTAALLTNGTWRVTYYHESNDDHTTNFSGYTFIFNSNGNMTATHSSGTTNGTWSQDDSSNELHISLGNNEPLKDLSKGWLIISKTSTEIKLMDDNSTHNEELHFTKN